MFLLLVGISATGAASFLGYKEYMARRKQHQLFQYVDYLTKDMRTNEAVRDSFLIGAGSTALSVFSVYLALEKHNEVLDIMEYRYPNELLDMTPLDWLTKVEQLYSDGDPALNGFVSGYAGQAAENITVEQFEAMGATATLFESRTHANDDLVVTKDGETIYYSVKSYTDSDSFVQAVHAHPESTHYVVNQELFAQLQDKGLLKQYEDQGITIVEGNYSHVALREEASQAFLDIHHAADVADHIPFLSIPLYALRSGFNIKAFREGKQSGNELTVNLVSDAGKVGVSSGLGFGGAKIGGVIGTAIFPGLGTVIGGGIGAIAGAFAGSKLLDSLKSHLKWGAIIEVQEKVGKTFERIGVEQYKQYILDSIFKVNDIAYKGQLAKENSYKFKRQLDIYSNQPASLPAVLNAMHIDHLDYLYTSFSKTAELLPQKIEHFAAQCAEKLKKPQAKHAFIGELLLKSRSDTDIWHPDDKHALSGDIEKYNKEVKKNPNYPYQYQLDADAIISSITTELMAEQLQPKQYYNSLMQNTMRYKTSIIVLSLISVASYMLFFIR